ncbi:hypothetical protein HanXRQr2_Chr10g0419131 [Helianthus annuus]|uniref:Uncharacterized protein n=1 Tax=Helianthus annuus TaxID=4232 RepID=A0A9K3HU49_HELAN|nr:hypothetical protein HanXRQr2_Chr10g0419131 [Helianthus annuus]KAJ0519774.1 hypothetical protein HanIR_Chr10g0451971 [Helianthus annuus]
MKMVTCRWWLPTMADGATTAAVQRLKEKIAELEQDKIEKHAVMEKIEESARLYAEMNERIQLLSQNPPPT